MTWVHSLEPTPTPTVPGASFTPTEFVPFRCDYLMASSPLAAIASNYGVVRTAASGAASDHYPIACEFG